MRHTCYHEVEAGSPAELGAKLGRLFGGLMRESVAEARAQRGWRRKLAIAGEQIAVTRRHFPQYLDELDAYARAAGLPLDHVWVVMCEDELDEMAAEKCTTVVTNGGRLVSHNEDWDEDSAEAICVLRKTLAGRTTLELHYTNTPLGGSALSVNAHGVVQAINSLSHTDGQIGVPRNVIARWLSDTRDPESDFRRLCELPRSAGYNHVLVGGGEVLDIECSATRQVMFRPRLPCAHTNHFLSSHLAGLEAAEGESTYRRYRSACALLKGSMTLAEMFTLNGDTANGKRASIMNRNTIGKVVVDLDARMAHIWLQREAEAGWVAYPLDFMAR
jgi:hypothetical protein